MTSVTKSAGPGRTITGRVKPRTDLERDRELLPLLRSLTASVMQKKFQVKLVTTPNRQRL